MTSGELVAYRSQMGYVPQSPFLMSGTVAENVAFSEWGRPLNKERIEQACRRAAIDFLGSDCENIDRAIGDNGAGLSGGQAQRVSIARALYAEPSLLILDEATSSLDQESEAYIQDTLKNLDKQQTCVIVAHRLTTLQSCDVVFWLDKGCVFASGTPEEILPRYAKEMAM